MVSSNFAVALDFTREIASLTPCSLTISTASASFFAFLLSFAMTSALHHFEAHRAGGAFDRLRRRLAVVGVQILHLQFGDLAQLGAGVLAGRHLARLLGARQIGRESCRESLCHYV